MKLIELENLSVAELKANRADLAQQIAAEPQEQFAARYIERTIDAKTRDEKLSEQGRTITALNDALDAKATELRDALASVAELKQEVSATNNTCNQLRESAVTKAAELEDTIRALRAKLQSTESERDSANKLASSRRLALVDVMNHSTQLTLKVSPLLAAEG
jgi:chromosome segregation ATPase